MSFTCPKRRKEGVCVSCLHYPNAYQFDPYSHPNNPYVFHPSRNKCCYPRKFNSRYCNEHALKSTLQKNRNGSRYPPPSTAEVLLNSLTHYVKKPRTRTTSSSTQHSDEGRNTPDEGAEAKATKSLDPFGKSLQQ